MEHLATIAILALTGWWLYTQGKRTGSRGGYHAGRSRRRRRR